MDRIAEHDVVLSDGQLRLRPMTEGDWDILLKWNNDPEVLYFAEGDDVKSRTLADTQGIYRGVSRGAFVFIAELDGRPIGECWLQRMNIDRISQRHPGKDLRRIDLTIGRKELWGEGWGTKMIRMLTELGFEREGADAIFGLFVADYNPRSRRAFEKSGYVVEKVIELPPGRKARREYDMMITRESWTGGRKER
ncbi:hypothetical protein LCGC14_1956760 [marine sediment metagenome]|uniref:N-acetyltransferase domain-containing protein n=1 Tax=marine sediment metagenome TaxID=412755 RepID=A0A0F9G436_9ZZZZ